MDPESYPNLFEDIYINSRFDSNFLAEFPPDYPFFGNPNPWLSPSITADFDNIFYYYFCGYSNDSSNSFVVPQYEKINLKLVNYLFNTLFTQPGNWEVLEAGKDFADYVNLIYT